LLSSSVPPELVEGWKEDDMFMVRQAHHERK